MNFKKTFLSGLLSFSLFGTGYATVDEKIKNYISVAEDQITQAKKELLNSVSDSSKKIHNAFWGALKYLEASMNSLQEITTKFLKGKRPDVTATEINDLVHRIQILLPSLNQEIFQKYFELFIKMQSRMSIYKEDDPKKQWQQLEKQTLQLFETLQEKVSAEQTKIETAKNAAPQVALIEQKQQEERREKIKSGAVFIQNIIILIDNSEKAFDENKPITKEFAIALCQQAAPIIANQHTLEEFFRLREINDVPNMAQLDWAQTNLIPWLQKNWTLYEPTITERTDNVLLLIPKKLSADQLVGVNNRLQEVTDWARFLERSPGGKKIKASQITYWFSPTQEVLWNIYMNGHGSLEPVKGDSLTDLFSHRRFNEPFDVSQYKVQIAGLDLLEFRNLVTESIRRTTNIFVYISCFSGGYNLYLPYVTPLLAPKGFLPETAQPRFTVVTASATDAVTTNQFKVSPTCYTGGKDENAGIYFAKFFESASRYAEQYLQGRSLGALHAVNYSEAELREMLTHLISKKDSWLDLLNIPQVKFPSAERFVYFPLDPHTILVLTGAKAQAAKAQDKPIVVPYDIEKIILNTSTGKHEFEKMRITPKFIGLAAEKVWQLQINTDEVPQILSLLPGIGIHVFDRIEAKKINFFSFASIFLFAGMYQQFTFKFPKYYFVKELIINRASQTGLKDYFAQWPDTQGQTLRLFNVLAAYNVSKAADEKTGVALFFSDSKGNTYFARMPHYITRAGKMTFNNMLDILDEGNTAIKNAAIHSMGESIDSIKKKPQEIVQQYLEIINNTTFPRFDWWKNEKLFLNYDEVIWIFKPLEQLIGFKQQELKKQMATAQNIEQLTPKTRSENMVKAILAADVALVQRLVQEPFDKTYQVIVQNILVEPGKPIVYRANPLPTDPTLLTFAQQLLEQQQKKGTTAATADQKQMIENLQKIVSLLEQAMK